MKNEWWKEFFNKDYLELYSDKVSEKKTQEETKLLEEILNKNKVIKVLDLACGQGRHSIALSKEGFNVTGLDYSKDLINIARQKAKREDLNTNFVEGDMLALPFLNQEFDAVINIFTAFGYFSEKKDDEKVISEVFRVLKPGGIFILDLPNPNNFFKNFKSSQRETSLNGFEIKTMSDFNPATKRWDVKIKRRKEDQFSEKSYGVRIYDKQEITAMLKNLGLLVKQIYGSFNGEIYASESKRMIILTEKPE